MSSDNSSHPNSAQPIWIPWGYTTSPHDGRVDDLIRTLEPVNYNDSNEEPRIPIRRRLTEQLDQLMPRFPSTNISFLIDAEFEEQRIRDRLWENTYDSLRELEKADRIGRDRFRALIASLDTAARLQSINLDTYTPHYDWGQSSDEPTVWSDDSEWNSNGESWDTAFDEQGRNVEWQEGASWETFNPSTMYFADDIVTSNTGGWGPDTLTLSPSSDTDSDSSYYSAPPLATIEEVDELDSSTDTDDDEDIPLIDNLDLAGRG